MTEEKNVKAKEEVKKEGKNELPMTIIIKTVDEKGKEQTETIADVLGCLILGYQDVKNMGVNEFYASRKLAHSAQDSVVGYWQRERQAKFTNNFLLALRKKYEEKKAEEGEKQETDKA